jgi:SAM-dependent methyltransferase
MMPEDIGERSPDFYPPLADPATCGENLVDLAQHAMDLAPRLCGTCLDYHILFTARRLSSGISGTLTDRQQIIQLIGDFFSQRSDIDNSPFEVLIVGSADAGQLATAAHAIRAQSEGAISSVRFTVLDICPTPLELCRRFADQHGITLVTHNINILTTESAFQADVILLHSLFHFLPPESHAQTIRKMADWLKPHGRMIFSIGLKSYSPSSERQKRRVERNKTVRSMVESGTLKLDESTRNLSDYFEGELALRPRRRASALDMDQARDLFLDGGMTIVSLEKIADTQYLRGGGGSTERHRILAVLAPGKE